MCVCVYVYVCVVNVLLCPVLCSQSGATPDYQFVCGSQVSHAYIHISTYVCTTYVPCIYIHVCLFVCMYIRICNIHTYVHVYYVCIRVFFVCTFVVHSREDDGINI